MGFFGDVKEIQEGWKKSGIWYKLLVIISIFFTTSSLTGLAGLIIQWRGFIKDGISFYHEWITQPVRSVFVFLNLNISESTFDFITLVSIAYFGGAIAMQKRKPPNKRASRSLTFTGVLVIIIALFTFDGFGTPEFLLLGILFITYTYYYLAAEDMKTKIILIRPLIALLFILILAAINKGLQAPI